MAEINIEKRLIALEADSHPPQNYRRRCKEMEAKVKVMENKIIQMEKLLQRQVQSIKNNLAAQDKNNFEKI